jgi:excisionase family DNA binding protein
METNVNRSVSPRLLNVRSASEFLGISCWSVRALVWDGCLPFVTVGRAHYIDRADLEDWISRSKERAGVGTLAGTRRKASANAMQS